MSPATRIRDAARIVVKVGSSLLLSDDGSVAVRWLESLAADLAALQARGAAVSVVSSGAIGLGRRRLRLTGPLKLEEQQAAAAAGQSALMNAWQNALAPHDIVAAQVLLTLADTEIRRRYLNARATLNTLLGLAAIPVINENDTTATDEIRYGDNDRLAAHVAQMSGADALVMLSDIDGLYDADPRATLTAAHIPVVTDITAAIAAMAGGPNAEAGAGSGGMVTKIEAAKIAAAAGCATIIAKGEIERPLQAILDGARATLFTPKESPETARRAWIAGRITPQGRIDIDAGAVDALAKGASLLAAGVTSASGAFGKGDAISIFGPDGALVGQGLSAYEADEVRRIAGMQSASIEKTLGYRRAAVVHRNDLTLRTGAAPRLVKDRP